MSDCTPVSTPVIKQFTCPDCGSEITNRPPRNWEQTTMSFTDKNTANRTKIKNEETCDTYHSMYKLASLRIDLKAKERNFVAVTPTMINSDNSVCNFQFVHVDAKCRGQWDVRRGMTHVASGEDASETQTTFVKLDEVGGSLKWSSSSKNDCCVKIYYHINDDGTTNNMTLTIEETDTEKVVLAMSGVCEIIDAMPVQESEETTVSSQSEALI